MNLENEIKEILQLNKFNTLTKEEKVIIYESILANCLILSEANKQKYLDIIRNRLASIVNLGEDNYYKDGTCYSGIVESKVIGPALDPENTTFPYSYDLKYKEYKTPFSRLTRSILHEFGHLVVKKDNVKLSNDVYLINMGGLVISKLLEDDYGHMFSEILNEFTTYLAHTAYLAYHTPNPVSESKMAAFANKMGLTMDSRIQYLEILPRDIFTSTIETSLATSSIEKGTEKMFNLLYTKYSPLVKLIMHSFQNPMYTKEDLKKEFEKGRGLSATINNEPINDLMYGYYESSIHTQNLFDGIMNNHGEWENFCLKFDSKMMDTQVDKEFVENAVALFTSFYEKRVSLFMNNGEISSEQTQKLLNEFYATVDSCMKYYSQIEGKSFS